MVKKLRQNPKISNSKPHRPLKNWQHNARRYSLLALVGLVLSSSSNLLLTNLVSAEDQTSWTFEEALAAREVYEPQIREKCQTDIFCELTEYIELTQNKAPGAHAAYILASNSIVLTSFYPDTGAIKFFYNDRAAVLQTRNQTDAGLSMPLSSITLVWHFKDTDETYTFTDVDRIIPQQEIEIVPEGLHLTEANILESVEMKIETMGGDTPANTLSTNRCLSSPGYAPGRECRVQASATLGFVHYPVVPPTPDPEPEPDTESEPKPEPQPESKPNPEPEPQPDINLEDSSTPNPIQPPFITPTLPFPVLITPVPTTTSSDMPDRELGALPDLMPTPDSQTSATSKNDENTSINQSRSVTTSTNPSIPLAPNTGRPQSSIKPAQNSRKLQKKSRKSIDKTSVVR